MQARLRKIAQVWDAFRASIPANEFNEKDWDALRVAIRIVYETEELKGALRRKRSPERNRAVSYWLDSIESGITFMSWTRELADTATGTTYPLHFPTEPSKLWVRHSSLARRLLAARATPAERLSMLIELGGIEISLMGRLWASRPVYDSRIVRRAATILKQLRVRGGRKEPLTEAEFDELLRTPKPLSRRASRGPNERKRSRPSSRRGGTKRK